MDVKHPSEKLEHLTTTKCRNPKYDHIWLTAAVKISKFTSSRMPQHP